MESDKQAVFQTSKQAIKVQGLEQQIQLVLTQSYNIARESNKFQLEEKQNLRCQAKPQDAGQITKIQGFEKSIREISKEFKVDMSFDIGDFFPIIRNNHLIEEDKTVDIEHKKGEVILLDIWATWCGPCQKPMQHNQANADKWGDKVRIICLSVDDQKETVAERLKDKNWSLGEQYCSKGWDPNHDAINYFQVQGIPKIILVNKEGIIVHNGHPSSVNLEEKINSLLEQESNDVKAESTLAKNEETQGLSEEQYQQGYNFFKDVLVPKLNGDFVTFTGKIIIDGTKKTEYKNDQDLIVYSKFKIELTVPSKQKEMGETIRDLLKPISSDIYTLEYILDDPKEEVLRQVKKLSTLYIENNFQTIKFTVCHKKQLKVVDKQLKFETATTFKQYKPLDSVDKKDEQAWKQGLETYIDELYNKQQNYQMLIELFYAGIEQSIAGKPLPVFKNVHKTGSPTDKLDLELNQGVVLVDFWAPWCGPCLAAMKKNMALKQKYPDIKIVALSLDAHKDEDLQFIEKKGWKDIDFYQFVGSSKDSEEVKFFGVSSIPYVVLAKNGVLKYAGGADKVAKQLEDIMNGKAEEQADTKDYEDSYRKAKVVLQQMFTSEEFSKTVSELKYQPKIEFQAARNRIMKGTGEYEKKEFLKSQISLGLRRSDLPKIQKYIDQFINHVGKDNVEVKEDLLETVDIPLGDLCVVCKGNIEKQDPHYYCYHTKEHVCRDCGDFEDKTKKTIDGRYKYPHNLVYINIKGNVELLKDIDVYKLGKDVQPALGVESSQGCTYGCNGCGNTPPIKGESCDGVRYICLTCRPGPILPDGYCDFCHSCFIVANDQNHSEHANYKEKYTQDGHDYNHLMLKILFDNGGYYDF